MDALQLSSGSASCRQASPLVLLLRRRLSSSHGAPTHASKFSSLSSPLIAWSRQCGFRAARLTFPSTATVACSSSGGISGNKVAYRLARDFQFANSSEGPTVLSIHSPLPPPAASADRTISLPIDFYKVRPRPMSSPALLGNNVPVACTISFLIGSPWCVWRIC